MGIFAKIYLPLKFCGTGRLNKEDFMVLVTPDFQFTGNCEDAIHLYEKAFDTNEWFFVIMKVKFKESKKCQIKSIKTVNVHIPVTVTEIAPPVRNITAKTAL
jgi:hypothetical protein